MSDASKSEAEFVLDFGYLREAVPDRAADLTPDTKILDIIDSFSFVEMFEFVELEMKVVIDLSAAEPKDLATVQRFAKFLAKT